MALDTPPFSPLSPRYKYVMHVSLVLRFDLPALIYGASAEKYAILCYAMRPHKSERKNSHSRRSSHGRSESGFN